MALSVVAAVEWTAQPPISDIRERCVTSADTDRRRYSRLEKPLVAVDLVLLEWGRWMRGADDVLGWPRYSILEKVRREREGAAQATAPVVIPEGVMATDAAIARLPDIRRQVVRVAYLHHPNAPTEVQRRKLRMSAYRWKALLKESRIAVACVLGIAC